MEDKLANFISLQVNRLAESVPLLISTGAAAVGLTVAGGLSTAAELIPQEPAAVAQERQPAPQAEESTGFLGMGEVLSPIQLGLGLTADGLIIAATARRVRRQERSG